MKDKDKKPLTAEQIKKLEEEKQVKKLTNQLIIKNDARDTRLKR
jgi:hypothetical protein